MRSRDMILIWVFPEFSEFRLLPLPVHTRDKNMLCPPIKIQSFGNQTSKFSLPLGNVFAPLRKYLKGNKVTKAYGHFVFCSFENQNE